jgi:hypothetical protein
MPNSKDDRDAARGLAILLALSLPITLRLAFDVSWPWAIIVGAGSSALVIAYKTATDPCFWGHAVRFGGCHCDRCGAVSHAFEEISEEGPCGHCYEGTVTG